MSLAKSTELETSRIEEAYGRRKGSLRKEQYSVFHRANVLRIQELERRVLHCIARLNGSRLHTKRILEIGCGTGYWLRQFIQWGARPENLAGVDLLPERIAEAKQLCPSTVKLECENASRLKFRDGSFDLVCQFTVFTSIFDPGIKKAIASEMLRVLKAGGFILWYDFFANNPWNPDVRGVGKKEIVQLFPSCRVHLKRVTLAPPFGRILGRVSPLAYQLTSALRVFCTHYLGLIEKDELDP